MCVALATSSIFVVMVPRVDLLMFVLMFMPRDNCTMWQYCEGKMLSYALTLGMPLSLCCYQYIFLVVFQSSWLFAVVHQVAA